MRERSAAQTSAAMGVGVRHLQGPRLHQDWVREKITAFHSKLAQLEFSECTTCLEAFPSIRLRNDSSECIRCSCDKKMPKLYSRDNAMDADPVPSELQGLTPVEEILILAVMPMMALYRPPHGQIDYKGHVINLPQDISHLFRSLPRHSHDLDVIVVRREGSTSTHHDFRV